MNDIPPNRTANALFIFCWLLPGLYLLPIVIFLPTRTSPTLIENIAGIGLLLFPLLTIGCGIFAAYIQLARTQAEHVPLKPKKIAWLTFTYCFIQILLAPIVCGVTALFLSPFTNY